MNIYSCRVPLLYELVQEERTIVGKLAYRMGYVTFYDINGNAFLTFYGALDSELKHMVLTAELADMFVALGESVK